VFTAHAKKFLSVNGFHPMDRRRPGRLSLTHGAQVKRDELFASIEALTEAKRPGRDDVVYLERCGDEYDWRIVPTDGPLTDGQGSRKPEPDAWMSFSADWPLDDSERLRAFFDDLLAELESMAAPADRCRWPVDQPWPHFH
jgi:hypothetical protein